MENIMKELFKKIYKLSFICLKTTDTTDKMFKIMEKNSTNLLISSKQDPDEFFGSVTSSILTSYTKHG